MFKNTMEWIKKITRKETNSETGMLMPFLGSALHSSKKEAMAGLLYETMRSKNKQPGERIFVKELMEVIRELEENERLPTTYKQFPKSCWNAFWEMSDEGLLIVHQVHQKDEEGEDFIVVTEKLNKLLSPAIDHREKIPL